MTAIEIGKRIFLTFPHAVGVGKLSCKVWYGDLNAVLAMDKKTVNEST